MENKRWLRGLSTTLAFLSALLISGELIATSSSDYKGMIDGLFGINFSSGSGSQESFMFDSEYDSTVKMYTKRAEIAAQIGEEGCVLLKNKNNALPLNSSSESPKKVMVLGSRAFTYNENGDVRDTSSGKQLSFYAGIVGSPIYKQQVTLENEILSLPITLEKAFSDENIIINPSCKKVYSGKNYPSYVSGSEANGSSGGPYAVNEPHVSMSEFSDVDKYNDACFVVIGRTSGEGREYFPGQNGILDKNDGSKSALNLSDNERNLIKEAHKMSDKVIVLINSAVAMEIDELKADTELSEMVDSILWIGLPGSYGLRGMGRVISGKASPSGCLPDTYAVDFSSSPAAMNFGVTAQNGQKFSWSNPGFYTKADNNHYVVCAENIYTGYYYYETRYFDSIMGDGNANSNAGLGRGATSSNWLYQDEISYPFGYGLSYTDFKMEILEKEGSKFTYNHEEKAFYVDVKVTNIGDKPGKKTVQLYASSPYTQYDKEHKIEKSAVQLVNFEKTDTLYPLSESGEGKPNSQVLTIKADLKYIASYDETCSHDGVTGGYILEDGNYYLSVASNSHDAVNNVILNKDSNLETKIYDEDKSANKDLAVSFNPAQISEITQDAKGAFLNGVNATLLNITDDNVVIKNQLQDANYNFFKKDTIKYLSRSNWQDTFPISYTNLSVEDGMRKYLGTSETNGGRVYEFKTGTSNVKFGVDHSEEIDENGEYKKNKSIAEYKGFAYDDERWDYLLEQITFDEAWKFSPYGGTNCEPFISVNAPTVWQIDGPNGNVSRSVGNKSPKTGHLAVKNDDPNFNYMSSDMPCEVITAATYNKKLVEEQGKIYGEDGIWSRNHIIWAPGMNLHRTPFNSRNHEYYSEDPMLTNIIGVSFTRGGISKGMIVSAKHFAFNTQESYREGLSQFMNEQSCREMELRAFQGLSQDVNFVNSSGNTINGLGLMTSFSRIGVCGVNAHTGLMKNILRGEWGFKGLISTDMVVEGRFFNPQDSVINNVTFMATSNAANLLKNFWPEYNNKENVRKDPYLCEALYENMHYYMYSLANSSALNGIDPNTDIKEAEGSLSPWEIGLISGSCISGISAIVALGFYLYLNNGQKKENKEVTNND